MMNDSKICKQQADDKSPVNSVGLEYANIGWQMLLSKLILFKKKRFKELKKFKYAGIVTQNDMGIGYCM